MFDKSNVFAKFMFANNILKDSACGKPETPQVGLGDANPDTNVTYLKKYVIYSN